MARLVAYCRVSAEGQRDNTSLDHQLRRIRAYAESAGHEIVLEFQDVESASGKKYRPAFEKALRRVFSDQADGVICLKLDRFARSTMEGLRVARELRDAGKQLVILDLNLDTSNAIGECIFTVLLAFAQLERQTIQERTRAGYRAKVERGGYGSGHPPYGWNAVGHELVENAEEQKWRQKIFEWWTEGISAYRISMLLNEQGVPTKRGLTWHPRTVWMMCSKPSRMAARLAEKLPATEARAEPTFREFAMNALRTGDGTFACNACGERWTIRSGCIATGSDEYWRHQIPHISRAGMSRPNLQKLYSDMGIRYGSASCSVPAVGWS